MGRREEEDGKEGGRGWEGGRRRIDRGGRRRMGRRGERKGREGKMLQAVFPISNLDNKNKNRTLLITRGCLTVLRGVHWLWFS